MIILNDEQIEDCRHGIEREMCHRLGHFISIRIHPDEDLKFIAKDLPIEYREVFDEVCRDHINRACKIGFDS